MDEKKTRYRTYTEEFKSEILELLKSSGKTARQIQRDLGITPGLLVKWRDRNQVISKEAEQAHLALSDMEAAKREIKRLPAGSKVTATFSKFQCTKTPAVRGLCALEWE